MNLLVVCPYLPDPPDHGGRIRSRVLVDALAELGTVQLAVPAGEARTFAPGIAVHALAPAAAEPSLPGKLAAWARGRSELLGRKFAPEAATQVAELLAAHRFDAVVADSSFVLPLLPARLVPPLVVNLHNVESAVLARPLSTAPRLVERAQRQVEARLMARVEAAALRRARLTLAVSALDREHALRLAPDARVEVVENSVDVAALPYLPPPDPSRPLLLFVGSLDYPPNQEAVRELVDVHAPVLRQAFPGLRVRVVGRDPRGDLAAHVRAQGCEAVGFAQDLRPHYAAATCVYLPIRSGGGTRIKVLEALALGRAVLATRVAVEGLGLEPGRDYLAFETAAAGLAAVERVTHVDHESMRERGRALVEARFSHEQARARIRAALAAADLPTGRCG
jgi:glycosyltransferase involved in cell wall biosynthesis